MLDSDLAALYGVTTKRLNEQVRRNLKRFPQDFMYQLSAEEFESIRSHFATIKIGRGKHRKRYKRHYKRPIVAPIPHATGPWPLTPAHSHTHKIPNRFP
jgi:ORF6N domain-containing protein